MPSSESPSNFLDPHSQGDLGQAIKIDTKLLSPSENAFSDRSQTWGRSYSALNLDNDFSSYTNLEEPFKLFRDGLQDVINTSPSLSRLLEKSIDLTSTLITVSKDELEVLDELRLQTGERSSEILHEVESVIIQTTQNMQNHLGEQAKNFIDRHPESVQALEDLTHKVVEQTEGFAKNVGHSLKSGLQSGLAATYKGFKDLYSSVIEVETKLGLLPSSQPEIINSVDPSKLEVPIQESSELQISGSQTISISQPSETPKQTTSEYQKYTLQKGDILWNLSQKYIGNGAEWQQILHTDGSLFTNEQAKSLTVGLEVLIPKSSRFEVVGYLSVENQVADQLPYTIKANDTLWAISERLLGNGSFWKQIRETDGTTFTEAKARELHIGQVIYLPQKLSINLEAPESNSPESKTSGGDNQKPPSSNLFTDYSSSLISSNDYISLTIQSQDTLWDIAAERLGDPQDWITILNSDGTNFTEDEARRLQIGSTVYLPKNLSISLQYDEQSSDVIVSPTPDLQEYLNSIQTRVKIDNVLGDSDSSKDVISEDKLTPLSKPLSPFVQPNFGFKAELDKVFEGRNLDAGLVKAVVVNDGIEGKLSFELDSSTKDDSVKFALFDPDYAPTLSIEASLKRIVKEWETDIFTNLLKWKPGDLSKGAGLSLKVGQWNGLDMWISEVQGKLYDSEQGSPTTTVKMTVEGDFTDAIKKKYPSEEWVKRLGMTKVKVELAYDATIAWQAKPFPILKPLIPEPVPVYVNDPLPVYTQPRQLGDIRIFPMPEPTRQPEIPPQPIDKPVGINIFPMPEPTRQPEIRPQPIEVPKLQPVTSSLDQPVQAPSISPVITDPVRKSNFVDNTLEVINSPTVQKSALVAVGIVGVSVLLLSTPISAPVAAVAAGFIGLTTLPFWASNGGENS